MEHVFISKGLHRSTGRQVPDQQERPEELRRALMPRKRSRVRTHYRRGPNGPVMVRGHERGGFSPHPERFKGRRPRGQSNTDDMALVLVA